MDDQDYKSLILYYGREKLYHSMHNASIDGMTKFPGNLTFRVFNGFALVLGNRVQEGIRELTPLQNERDFNLPVILALIYGHKRCGVVDKEAIIALDQKMKEERKKVGHVSVYYASIFLYLSGKVDKAREYAEKALKMNPNFPEAMILLGWAELKLGTRLERSISDLFEKAVQMEKNWDGNLGQVRYYQMNNDFENAIGLLNKLAVRYPELNIPLVEKMKTEFSNWRWENAKETANRILGLDPLNFEAMQIKCTIIVCHEGNYKSGTIELQKLFVVMSKMEPYNADLFLQTGQLFSRVCGRNMAILEQSSKFVEKANHLSAGSASYLTEMGYQLVYMEKYKEAVKFFKQATKVDDSAIDALCGLTLCQLSESGASEQVSQQIEFLSELQGTVKLPLLLLMSARITSNVDQTIALLIEASEIHFKNLRTTSFGTDYLRLFNPTLLVDIALELLQFSPITIGKANSKEFLHISLKQSLNILEMIVKACPGLVKAVYLLAKVQFLCGDAQASVSTLQRILQNVDPTYTEAHLLISQIQIDEEQYQKAKQSLEVCLSHNFRVRENPVYHLLNGVVQKSFQHFDEAMKSFTVAMSLVNQNNDKGLSLADKVTLHLEMVNAYTQMNQTGEATKLMQEALDRFAETPEEGRLVIANADLALSQGRVSTALTLLGNIQSGEPYYMQSKTKMAQIYIQQKKDRLAYAQCFKEIVDNCPGAESYIMLGDAYMSIQEPDQAIDAYKQALRQSPRDPAIASKLGRAYVKTHQYQKAINYYREATASPDNAALKLDLAELYLKLKQFTNAEQTLSADIGQDISRDADDLEAAQLKTKQLLLLARVRERSGHLGASLTTLKEAKDHQYKVQKRISLEMPGGDQEQLRILSKICTLMAEQAVSIRDNDQAIQHYKEAIKNSPQDTVLLAAAARLYMLTNKMDLCQQICSQILQLDPKNEAASVMMADISFRKMDFESAAYHFSQLLLGQPTYWTALARLIEVMRRSGTIMAAAEFVERGEWACTQPTTHEAGLNFCKGIYEWYMGNPNTALRLFNVARRDSEWGKQAIFNMIEICINPDGDLPHENQVESQSEDARESQTMAIKTAEKLLKELKPKAGAMDNESLNYSLLESFILMASRQKHHVEQALQSFLNVAGQDEYRDHVGPILGMATAYVLLKQAQRAKNQLKRVAKNVWTFEDAEYLERCWLLLADLYIQANKLELASELLTRALDHNKTCVKGHELCGMVAEREQVYRSAAMHYDSAWKFSGKSKPALGYKLAYNHMKSKRYPDAIDVCHQVLKLHPDFATIKKDILDKCRNNLKL